MILLRRVCGSDGPVTAVYSVAWLLALVVSVVAAVKPW